jgi:hypothetical protein
MQDGKNSARCRGEMRTIRADRIFSSAWLVRRRFGSYYTNVENGLRLRYRTKSSRRRMGPEWGR